MIQPIEPVNLLAALQALLGGRVLLRMARTAAGSKIAPPTDQAAPHKCISVVVPVLDERRRLAPCLEGLLSQGCEVREILVVDGGSRDGTQTLVNSFAERDQRVHLIDASPVPEGWNGKAWGLQIGLDHSCSDSEWLLTIDADVRPARALAVALLQMAHSRGLDGLSVATQQELADAALSLLHPSLLTTLVYRYGIPGSEFDSWRKVQANGQCFLVRRAALLRYGGFGPARASLCEDITLARHLVVSGCRLGFYEAGDLARVEMYRSWREAWQGWTRSLPMRDQFTNGYDKLCEVTLVQALPLPLLALLAALRSRRRALLLINVALAAVRLGVLAGTARAYRQHPWTYWLSPICDLAVAAKLWSSALRRRHFWRGRQLIQMRSV